MLMAQDIVKRFAIKGKHGDDRRDVEALKGVSLTLQEGEFLSVVGRSGSGKSTLLSVLATLTTPDAGSLTFDGRDLARLRERRLNAVRHADFAVIFQFHYLLPYLTALENTLLPFMQSLRPVPAAVRERGRQALARVGLEGKEDRLPAMLSGGEQQRVAIARALAKDARVLFADEPTGSLDKATGQGVMRLLQELNRDGLSIVMVTHDQDYAGMGHRTLEMEDGLIVQ
jgi:putative ABC transport system ATP-binding protein